MSPLTIYLGKALGLYLVVFAVAFIINRERALRTIDEWMRSAPLMLLMDVITIGGGLALVIGHNVWSGGLLPIVVTLVGWCMLLKGLSFLFLPGAQATSLYQLLQFEKYFYAYMSVTLILGLYLTIAAFSAS